MKSLKMSKGYEHLQLDIKNDNKNQSTNFLLKKIPKKKQLIWLQLFQQTTWILTWKSDIVLICSSTPPLNWFGYEDNIRFKVSDRVV